MSSSQHPSITARQHITNRETPAEKAERLLVLAVLSEAEGHFDLADDYFAAAARAEQPTTN